VEAYAPAEIAERMENAGVVKAGLALEKLATLGVLAGVFIGIGGALYTLVMTGNDLGFGPGRLLGGVAFSLGLVLVVVAGAELFTGNALIVMAWADGRVTTMALLRNWAVVFVANGAGAVGLAAIISLSGILALGGQGETAARMAAAKLALPADEAFFRGVLCNMLVCLAVWLSFAARDVTGKVLAIVFPISAFVALGFEHSIANLYLIPVGLMAGAEGDIGGMIGNLVPVTAGNIVGGAGGVALVYWIIYRRPETAGGG
jgi:formate/nitrite transporter